MPIPYAGGTIVNTTYTCDGTLAGLLTKINTELKNAGWTVVSGDGTADVLFSTTTPQGCSCRFRFYNPGSGNCIQITLKNNGSPSALTSQIGYLIATNSGYTYRIIANKYQFFIFLSGGTYRTTARGIVMGGVPYITPAGNLTTMGSDLQVGWMQFNGSSDTDTGNDRKTMRDSLCYNGGYTLYASSLLTGYMINYNYTAQHPRVCSIPASSSNATSNILNSFLDDSIVKIEALIGWCTTSTSTATGKIIGQLWDAMVIGAKRTGEEVISDDSKTFIAITDNCGEVPYGTLYIRIT